MAGIPPAAGFVGKFYLFVENSKAGIFGTCIFSCGVGVVSIYYYVRVIRTMLKEILSRKCVHPFHPYLPKAVMIVSLAMTLILGVFPGRLWLDGTNCFYVDVVEGMEMQRIGD